MQKAHLKEINEEEREGETMVQPKERTLRDLLAFNVDQQLLYITYPAMTGKFKLKSGLIHLLPSFSGRAGEDPHKH